MPDESDRVRGDQGDWKPRPDPTKLTTEALQREVTTLRILLEIQIEANKEIYEERFLSMGRQLTFLEHQRIELKNDTKTALIDALRAQKELVQQQTIAAEKATNLAGTSINKLIDSLGKTFEASQSATADILSDVKSRVTVLESVKLGAQEQKRDISNLATLSATAIFVVIGVITIVTAIVTAKP